MSVSEWGQKSEIIKIGKKEIPVYPVYYPIGNGIFNIDKAIDDLNAIISNYEM